MGKHEHLWDVSSWSGDEVSYRCRCDARFTRLMDDEEKARYQADHAFDPPPEKNIHRVWHAVQEDLPDGWDEERDQDAKIALGEVFEKHAEIEPGQVVSLGCDDSHHASSDLVLVTHEAKAKWMGVTVVMIPQCDGKPPAQFFLYPGHVDALVDALHLIQMRSKEVADAERREEYEDGKWWAERARPESAIHTEDA